jgi:hypothetical protein
MLFASDNVFAKAQAIVKVKSPNSGQDARQTAGYLFLNEYFSTFAPDQPEFCPLLAHWPGKNAAHRLRRLQLSLTKLAKPCHCRRIFPTIAGYVSRMKLRNA